VDKEELQMSSTLTSVRPLVHSHTTFLLLKQTVMDFKDDLLNE